MATAKVKRGPTSQENWKASLVEDAIATGISEAEIYTDARIVGALEGPVALGPYSIINLVPRPDPTPGDPIAALVLRTYWHLDALDDWRTRSLERTEQSRHHGGSVDDEIAALLSLSAGCRFKVGAHTRIFANGEDPLGRPTARSGRPEPSMQRSDATGFVVASACGIHQLEATGALLGFPDLNGDDASAVVRAARLYQGALWIAEADPNSAWIMLVSALEVAAGSWSLSRHDSSAALFEEFEPDLATLLRKAGPVYLEAVAQKYVHLSRAKKKFLDFVDTFKPEPPTSRPGPAFQAKWDKLQEICGSVYNWRSAALHSGTPFPMPVCIPRPSCPGGGLAEIPMGVASGTHDSSWEHNDTFVLLNTFEHITRGALLKWWGALAEATASPPPASAERT